MRALTVRPRVILGTVFVWLLLTCTGCQYLRGPKVTAVDAEPVVPAKVDPQDLLFEAEQALQHGDYLQAEAAYRRVLSLQESADGPEASSVAGILNDLAGVYYVQDRYVEAEPLLQRVLAIYERRFGPDDPNVAASLNNLANLYRNRGKFELAEPLYRRAMRIQEQTLGTNHPDAKRTRKNFEALRKAQSGSGTTDENPDLRSIEW
jgi:tetratricopeptide (TPR) repeat protein